MTGGWSDGGAGGRKAGAGVAVPEIRPPDRSWEGSRICRFVLRASASSVLHLTKAWRRLPRRTLDIGFISRTIRWDTTPTDEHALD
jgi:hypothetical protein